MGEKKTFGIGKVLSNIRTKIVRSSMAQGGQISGGSFALTPEASFGGITNLVDFGAQTGRRGKEVTQLSSSPASTSLVNLTVARRRSRYAALTNPYAKRALDIWVSNVVGSGHKLVSLCSDPVFKKQIEALFTKWTAEADTTGAFPYGGIEALAFRSMAEGGDSFLQMRVRRPEDGFVVPLQLQLFEGEQVPITLNEMRGGNKIIGGIEFDPLDEPVAYHMTKDHPGDSTFSMSGNGTVPIRVPANFIIHLQDVRRPGQVRGLPFLSNVIIQLSEIDRYLDAELVRKKCAALIGGFIRTPNDGGAENPFVNSDNPDSNEISPMEPGTFPVLPPGYDVSFSNPADVGNNFDVFLKQELRAVAAGLNMTYEQLTGDLGNVTDRAIRVTMLEFKRIAEQYQRNVLVHQMHSKIFSRWFDLAVISGALKIPAGISEEDARKVKWIPDPWNYMNPTQEIDAIKAEIRCGLKSRSSELIARGLEPDEVDREIAADKAREKALGLVFDTDANAVTSAGVAQFEDPEKYLQSGSVDKGENLSG